MNPIPVLVVIFVVLAFEQALLGDEVAQSVEPFLLHVDTTREDCGALEAGCAIMNFVRPVLGGIATVLNAIIFVGALATFQIPGAPWWVTAGLAVPLDVSLIWSLVALLRGVRG